MFEISKIEIEDNSDAYQEEKIEYKSSAKGAIIKGFKGGYLGKTLLIGFTIIPIQKIRLEIN